jgi:hypothetical protein
MDGIEDGHGHSPEKPIYIPKIEYYPGTLGNLTKIDPVKIGEAAQAIGMDMRSVKNISIVGPQYEVTTGPRDSIIGGSADWEERRVSLMEYQLVKSIGDEYMKFLHLADNEPPFYQTQTGNEADQPRKRKDKIRDVIKKHMQAFFEPDRTIKINEEMIAYKLLKMDSKDLLQGGEERRLRYIEGIKNGTIDPQRGVEFYQGLIERAARRTLATITTHEYEHLRDVPRKMFIRTYLPWIAAGIMVSIGAGAEMGGVTNSLGNPFQIAGFLYELLVLGTIGRSAGRIYTTVSNEQASYDVQKYNYDKFLDAISLNEDMLNKIFTNIEDQYIKLRQHNPAP